MAGTRKPPATHRARPRASFCIRTRGAATLLAIRRAPARFRITGSPTTRSAGGSPKRAECGSARCRVSGERSLQRNGPRCTPHCEPGSGDARCATSHRVARVREQMRRFSDALVRAASKARPRNDKRRREYRHSAVGSRPCPRVRVACALGGRNRAFTSCRTRRRARRDCSRRLDGNDARFTLQNVHTRRRTTRIGARLDRTCDGKPGEAVAAVKANRDAAQTFGVAQERFRIWEWVGGAIRYGRRC